MSSIEQRLDRIEQSLERLDRLKQALVYLATNHPKQEVYTHVQRMILGPPVADAGAPPTTHPKV